jgi:hypothetical protein
MGTLDLGNHWQALLSRDFLGCCNYDVLFPVLPASVLPVTVPVCCLRSQSVQIL